MPALDKPSTFSTPSKEFHFWVCTRLEDGQKYSKADLIRYARPHMEDPQVLRPGVVSGVLYRLANSKDYFSPERGYYQKRALEPLAVPMPGMDKKALPEKGEDEKEPFVYASFQKKLLEILLEFDQRLRQCCTVDLTEVSEEDFEMIKRIRPILQTLKDLEGELSS